MSKGGEAPVVVSDHTKEMAPHNLVDVISYIDFYHAMEAAGNEIDPRIFTFKSKLRFFGCGIIESAWSGTVSLLFTPLAIGVLERYIPVFGTTNPGLFDKIFSFVLALSFTLIYAFIFADIGKKYQGAFTKSIIRKFFSGVFTGKVFFVSLGFILYHHIYIKVATEDNIIAFLKKFDIVLSPQSIVKTYWWMMDFRPVLLMSAWLLVVTTVIFICIPMMSIFVTVRRSKNL